jgi:hypothetical protein
LGVLGDIDKGGAARMIIHGTGKVPSNIEVRNAKGEVKWLIEIILFS